MKEKIACAMDYSMKLSNTVSTHSSQLMNLLHIKKWYNAYLLVFGSMNLGSINICKVWLNEHARALKVVSTVQSTFNVVYVLYLFLAFKRIPNCSLAAFIGIESYRFQESFSCACVRACVRACVCVCVCYQDWFSHGLERKQTMVL